LGHILAAANRTSTFDWYVCRRQIKVLNRLLDGFEGKLTTSKWAAMA
jgi:hypothetical protein